MMTAKRLLPLGLVFPFVLTACAGPPGGPDASLAYQEGYRYGCALGWDAVGYINHWERTLSPPRYGDSPEWKVAWETGYRECFDEAIERPMPNPGAAH